MTDELVMRIPGTYDSYQVVKETWNRPGKLWVVLLDKEIDHNLIACAVYAKTQVEADIKAHLTYNGYLNITNWRWDGSTEDPTELTFDENGVSNVWVW